VPAGFGNLDEDDALAHVRAQFQQALDGEKFLVDPFCVVEAIDTDDESDVRWQSEGVPHRPTAGLDRR
jgi:hypothetical protein